MSFDLISPLPLKECLRRLRAATDGRWAIAGDKPVLGYVGDTSIRLRKRIWYRNSFQCWLSAKLNEENGETRLHCTIGLHPVLRRFVEIWIGLVLVAAGAVLIKTIRVIISDAGALPSNWWLGIVVPLILLGFAVLLLTLGDYLSQDDPAFLVEFLERTIRARPDDAA